MQHRSPRLIMLQFHLKLERISHPQVRKNLTSTGETMLMPGLSLPPVGHMISSMQTSLPPSLPSPLPSLICISPFQGQLASPKYPYLMTHPSLFELCHPLVTGSKLKIPNDPYSYHPTPFASASSTESSSHRYNGQTVEPPTNPPGSWSRSGPPAGRRGPGTAATRDRVRAARPGNPPGNRPESRPR
eukprot:756370-Hanusia_phi.AAC.1